MRIGRNHSTQSHTENAFKSAIRNPQSAILTGVWCKASIRVLGTRGDSSTLSSPTTYASLVQLVQDTALPSLRHRFESGTMLQIQLRPRSLTEERFASNESGMGSSPIGGSKQQFLAG